VENGKIYCFICLLESVYKMSIIKEKIIFFSKEFWSCFCKASFVEAYIHIFLEKKDTETKYADSEMSSLELDYQSLLIEISFAIMVYVDSFKLEGAVN